MCVCVCVHVCVGLFAADIINYHAAEKDLQLCVCVWGGGGGGGH